MNIEPAILEREMTTDHHYDIRTDVKFQPLQPIDIKEIGQGHEPWFNQSLCRVNDCVVRIGILHGEFHWHHHDKEDEFFYVIEGRLLIDLPDKEPVELRPGQAFTVPKGIEHRTRAPQRTVVLMFEGADVVPTGS